MLTGLRRFLVRFSRGSIIHVTVLLVINLVLFGMMIGAALDFLSFFIDFETAQKILFLPIAALFPFFFFPLLLIGERIWMLFGIYRLIGARDFFFRDYIVRILQPGEE